MEIVVLACRILLAIVFLVAGAAKLADLPGSRKSMLDFRMPEALAGPLGLLLPIGEILIGLALLPKEFAWYGGIGSLALLALFIVGIVVALAQGRTPDCHCFGQLHSKPIGFATIARNLIFCALATVIIRQGPQQPAMLGWTQRFSGTQLALIFGGSALFLLLVLNLWMMLQILKQNGRTLLRVEALEAGAGLPAPISALPPAPALLQAPGPGEAAPEVELPDLNGEKVDLKSFLGKPAFLLFWNPGCGFCQKMLDRVKAWENNGATDLLVISTGSVEANRAQGFRSSVVLDTDFSAGNAFGASGTPSAIKISAEGRVASLVAVGADDVMRLLS